jgi:2-methylcitrate dehydratase PrpD
MRPRIEQPVSPITAQLSAYIATAIRKRLPAEVVERAKIHIVDTFAAMVSGSRLPPGEIATQYVRTLGGRAEAGVIGSRIVTSAAHAALANGMNGHADETDDTHPASITHPGTSVVPAALAIGEREDVSGRSLLRAIVLGYEICARVPLSMQPTQFLRSGLQEGVFGQLFGSAAAAGALLRLDARRIRYMLGNAAQQASGIYTMFRDPEHVEKAYAMGGMPAHNGVAAALMVVAGFTGVEDPFSGERDFYLAFRKSSEPPRREELTRGLGRDFEIMRGGIKRWPTGGPIQGPLHVLRELIARHRFTADDVEELSARMPDKDLEQVNDRDMPDISVQHLLALMLIDCTITFGSAHDYPRMRDPRVLAVKRRVRAIGDPALVDPQRRWRCVMEVVLRDGRRLQHQTMASKGTYENPLTRAEEEEKALDLLVPVLGAKRSRALLQSLWDLDKLDHVRALRKLYAA